MKPLFILLFFSAALYCQSSFALICPTPLQIQQGNFLGFTPIDIDNDEPVSKTMIAYFEKHVNHFYMAEWMPDTLYPSHCYYHLNDENGWSQTYLGNKQSVEPQGPFWKKLFARMTCDKGVAECQFPNISNF